MRVFRVVFKWDSTVYVTMEALHGLQGKTVHSENNIIGQDLLEAADKKIH